MKHPIVLLWWNIIQDIIIVFINIGEFVQFDNNKNV